VQLGSFSIARFRLWRGRCARRAAGRPASPADRLASALAELDQQGWDLDAFLSEHGDLTPTVEAAIRAAARVRRAPRPVPSPEFRARAQARFAVHVLHDRGQTPWRRRLVGLLMPAARSVAAACAAALVLVFALSGIRTASASALPGSPLYPAKLAVEQINLLVAISPDARAQAHLNIAMDRLAEAEAAARQENLALVPALLESYEQQVTSARLAAQAASPASRDVIARRIAQLDDQHRQIAPLVDRAERPTPPTATPLAPTAVPVVTPSPVTARSIVSRPSPPYPGAAGDHPEAGGRENKPPDIRTVPTAVPPVVHVTPSAASRARPTIPPDQALDTLIARALDGDADGANAALAVYVEQLRARLSEPNGQGRLQNDRVRLQAALSRVTGPARQPIEAALQALGTGSDNGTGPAGSDRPSAAMRDRSENRHEPSARGGRPSSPGFSQDRTPGPRGVPDRPGLTVPAIPADWSGVPSRGVINRTAAGTGPLRDHPLPADSRSSRPPPKDAVGGSGHSASPRRDPPAAVDDEPSSESKVIPRRGWGTIDEPASPSAVLDESTDRPDDRRRSSSTARSGFHGYQR
jgi:hypothetical protein